MNPKTLNALVHNREAALYDERFSIRFDGRSFERDLTRAIGAKPASKRALDYCCGTGYAGIGLALSGIAAEVHGCDLSYEMLQRTREHSGDVRLTLCDGERLPYADDAFDLVIARGALHHLPDPVAALREVRRVLSHDGIAVVLAEPTPNGERQVAAVVGTLARGIEALRRLMRRPVDEEHHNWELASMAANLHTFDAPDIERIAREAGFEHVEANTAWWAWVLALGLSYYLAGEYALVRKARLPRLVFVEATAALDRRFDRLVPKTWRHTVQAVLR